MRMTRHLQQMMLMDAKMMGTFDVDKGALASIEEHLTGGEYEEISNFYAWLIENDRTFGWNLPDVWKEYKRSMNVSNKDKAPA